MRCGLRAGEPGSVQQPQRLPAQEPGYAVRAENPSTSGDRRVLVEDAAEPITAPDAVVVQVDGFGQRP